MSSRGVSRSWVYHAQDNIINLIERLATPGVTGPTGMHGQAANTGSTGPTGPTGPLGFTGPTGMHGQAANTGATGYTGFTGPTGPTGKHGQAAGTGATGATGATGIIGPTGPHGASANTGNTGSTGPTGPSGVTGPTGKHGQAASTGATGYTGYTGVTGPTGKHGQAASTGATGPTGPIGFTGPTGMHGQAAGTGATGPTGPIGFTGPTGMHGQAAGTGATGPTGPTGSKGDQGFTGPTGPMAPTSFTVAGSLGTPQTVSNGQTLNIQGTAGVSTIAQPTRILRISAPGDIYTFGPVAAQNYTSPNQFSVANGTYAVFHAVGRMVTFWYFIGLGNFQSPFGNLEIFMPKPDSNGNPDGSSNNTLVKAYDDPQNRYKASGPVVITGSPDAIAQGPLVWQLIENSATLMIGSYGGNSKFFPLEITSTSNPIGFGTQILLSGSYLRNSTASLPSF